MTNTELLDRVKKAFESDAAFRVALLEHVLNTPIDNWNDVRIGPPRFTTEAGPDSDDFAR